MYNGIYDKNDKDYVDNSDEILYDDFINEINFKHTYAREFNVEGFILINNEICENI